MFKSHCQCIFLINYDDLYGISHEQIQTKTMQGIVVLHVTVNNSHSNFLLKSVSKHCEIISVYLLFLLYFSIQDLIEDMRKRPLLAILSV